MATYRTTHREPGDHVGGIIVRLGGDGKTWLWGTAVWVRGEVLAVDRWEKVEEYE